MSINSDEETKVSDKKDYDCQTITKRCRPQNNQRTFVEKTAVYWQTTGQDLVANAQNVQAPDAAQDIIDEIPDLIPADTPYIGVFDYQIDENESEDKPPVKRFAILCDNLQVDYFIEHSKIQDIELEAICRAVAYLRSNVKVRACLVDLLVRDKDLANLKGVGQEKPEVHTTVLYKPEGLDESEASEYLQNREAGFRIETTSLQKFQAKGSDQEFPLKDKEYFRLQDPSTEIFSAILKQATFEEKNIVLLFPAKKSHAFYRTAATMKDTDRYRDCIDVGLKIANYLNGGKNDYERYSNTQRGEAVKALSRLITHVGCKQLQSSTEETRKRTYNYFETKWGKAETFKSQVPDKPKKKNLSEEDYQEKEEKYLKDMVVFQHQVIDEWYLRISPDPSQKINSKDIYI